MEPNRKPAPDAMRRILPNGLTVPTPPGTPPGPSAAAHRRPATPPSRDAPVPGAPRAGTGAAAVAAVVAHRPRRRPPDAAPPPGERESGASAPSPTASPAASAP